MRERIFDLVLCLLLTGCAITNRDITPSERQEITVTGTDPIFIGMKLKDEMLKLGYSIREQSGHSIAFEKQITGWTGAMRPEGRYNMQPNSRVTYTLIEQNKTVRVVADLKIITYPDSRFERVADTVQHPDSTSIKEILWQVEHYLENQKKETLKNGR
ncbi:MAG TPA: hypothetical protein DIU00_16405 [Phycisphaerales bacterium]|nr:hypothetical protein [Phycisphaerales bacterium]